MKSLFSIQNPSTKNENANLIPKELAETSNSKKLTQCKNDTGMEEKSNVIQPGFQDSESLDTWTELKGILKKETRFKSRLSQETPEKEQNKEEAYVILEETAKILRSSIKRKQEEATIKKATKVKVGRKFKYPWARSPQGKWKVEKDGKVLYP